MPTRLVDAEGMLLRPLWKAAQLIAGCAQWQFITAKITPAEAYERIRWPEADDRPDPDHETQPRHHRPRIIVERGSRWHSERRDTAAWVSEGTIVMTVELLLAEETTFWPTNFWPENYWPTNFWPAFDVSREDQKRWADQQIGILIAQMQVRSAGRAVADDDVQDPQNDSLMNVLDVQERHPPFIEDESEHRGAYFCAAMYEFDFF